MSYSISKAGQFIVSEIEEYIYEPDGSIWQHVFHHNNPAINLFSSSDPFETGVYKSDDMWFNFGICNQLTSQWEFIYAQNSTNIQTTSKYRWIQTKNPFVATYDDVKPASVTRITSGYTNNSMGGLCHNDSTKCYFTIADGTSGHWFGATGSWTAYQGGIPGFPSTVVTTGCIDIYVRVDSLVKQANIQKIGIATAGGQFYEY